MRPTMRVTIIDRRDVFRKGLEHILQSRDIEVLGSYSSWFEVAKMQDAPPAQVVILDIDAEPKQKPGAYIRKVKGKFDEEDQV